MNDIGNYSAHAKYWDFGGIDRTPEHEYWLRYAKKYGYCVLIPMCALAETGAYMAERGFSVTAFDLTPEMISEAKKRFGHLPNLRLFVGDVCDFSFDIEPADFAFCSDFGHIHSLEDTARALECVCKHLRTGGCFVLETNLRSPDESSWASEERTFEPQKQIYPNLKVWKVGSSRYDAETGRQYIMQTFYAEHKDGKVESFDHEFALQRFTRDEWLGVISKSGFEIVGEYSDRDLNTWNSGNGLLVFELIRK